MSITQRNLSGYDLPVIEWDRVRRALATDYTQAPGTGGPDRHTSWLTTTNADGSPHVRPVGAVQVDGVRYFNSGPATRKSRNIAADPQCVLSIATQQFDLVIEGHAVRVTDVDELNTVVEVFRRGGWPAQVDGDALTAEFSAPSAGPPPWWLYRIDAQSVFAFGTDDTSGATKYEVSSDD
jgi:hypothetical protein